MIEKHTPGRLNVAVEIFDNDGMPETVIQGLGAAASVAVVLDFGANNLGMREANARRLVASWNACEGIPTNILEQHYGDAGGIDAALNEASLCDHLKAIQQRDELLAALKSVLSLVDRDAPQLSGKTIGAARAAIAKAEGGATSQPAQPVVQHLPADDTEGGAA